MTADADALAADALATDDADDAARAADFVGAPLARLSAVNAALSERFRAAGFAATEPSVLQPADLLFDLYGEEIWERAFVVDDDRVGSLCLRPDFTVPVARAHLAGFADLAEAPAARRADDAGAVASAASARAAAEVEPARYSYLGPVFRRADTSGGPLQHLQAGVEVLGEADAVARDAEVFLLCRDAIEALGCGEISWMTGDLGVAFALLDRIEMPASWRRRLKRHFRRPERFSEILTRYGDAASDERAPGRAAFLKAIGSLGAAEATEAVLEMLAVADFPQIGVRSAAEAADRFVRQAADAKWPPLSSEVITLVGAVLDVSGPSDAAAARLRELIAAAGLGDLKPALDQLDARLSALDAAGVAPSTLPFHAAFGRNLDYYDGFVFEMHGVEPGSGRRLKLGGGGRYDGLFRAMGAPAALTGVGAALRPEAILRVGGGAPEGAGS